MYSYLFYIFGIAFIALLHIFNHLILKIHISLIFNQLTRYGVSSSLSASKMAAPRSGVLLFIAEGKACFKAKQ